MSGVNYRAATGSPTYICIQYICDGLVTKKWKVLYKNQTQKMTQEFGTLVYHKKDNTIHFFPSERIMLSTDQLYRIIGLMQKQIDEESRLQVS